MKPNISIVIATLNSEKILTKVLISLQKQTYPRRKMEILVIDGGSSDNTLAIAKKHGCKTVSNPKTVPAWAKYIGYKKAKGKYLMYLDSDEVIEREDSIARKIEVFLKNPHVRAVTGSGYKNPKGYSLLNQYVNEFGDPFSFFIYRLSKDTKFFVKAMRQRYYAVSETKNHIVFDFSESKRLPIFELVAMGSVVDLVYLKSHFPKIMTTPGLIPHLFNLLVSNNSHVALLKNDSLRHYSTDTLAKYLGKITSRVVNNVFTAAEEGFKGRSRFLRGFSAYKKYFFVPYAFSIVIPLLDSIYLSFSRKNAGYFIHMPLCLYSASLIIYFMILKATGYRPILKSYGQAKAIS